MLSNTRPFIRHAAALPLIMLFSSAGCSDASELPGDASYSTSSESIVCDDCAIGVTAGYEHTCVLLDDNSVKCWGRNDAGQLGLGDTNDRGDGSGEMGASLPTVPLGTGRTALAVKAGNDHTCALLDNHKVKCWGANFNGQLGLGDNVSRGDGPGEMGDDLPTVRLGTGRTALDIAVGDFHTCALLDNHSIKCWGYNTFGMLGIGNGSDQGNASGEMGDNLPTVKLGTGRTALAIAAGGTSTCALLDNHKVKCWGASDRGQLGLGDEETRGDEAGEMGNNLPVVPLGAGRTAVAISTGETFACALLDNATLKCWGMGAYGQLGQGDASDRGDDPNELGNYLPALDIARPATAISTGEYFACGLFDAEVKCWGMGGYGQLGRGSFTSIGDQPGELPGFVDLGSGKTALAVATGGYHTCALLHTNRVKCWGYNLYGQLGQGDTTDRGSGPGEMGDNLPMINLD